MPLVVQLDAGIDVSPGLLEAAGHRRQAGETLGGKFGNQIEREWLEHGQDGAHFTQLLGSQRTDSEPSSYLCVEGALPGQPDQGLTDRGAADAQLLGNVSVADAAARGEGSALNSL